MTLGVGSTGVTGAAALLGVGAPVTKSAALSSVSTKSVRLTEVVLLGALAAAPSTLTAVPKPTRSTEVPSGAMSWTVPAVALSAWVQVASGVGRGLAPAVPLASWTRKSPPAAMVPARVQVPPVVPAAEK